MFIIFGLIENYLEHQHRIGKIEHMHFNVRKNKSTHFKNKIFYLNNSRRNDNRNVRSSMETTHPIEIERLITTKKIASRSFNYTNDYNSQMIKAGMTIKYPG